MKKFSILYVLFLNVFFVFSQDEKLKIKLDSIIAEADLMYKYEKTVWNSTDLLMQDENLKKIYGTYITRHSKDTIYVTYVDRDLKKSIARYNFTHTNLIKPNYIDFDNSKLLPIEKELLDIKMEILNQISDSKYDVTLAKGYNPNFVLLSEVSSYKLYMIMGTTENGVIPFGNDYLFWADSKGKIFKHKKFHSRMIPVNSKGPNGEKVISSFHSHLKTTPYVTATDICTFRLYAEICSMEEFTVLCTATDKYYKYLLKSNSIEVVEKKEQ